MRKFPFRTGLMVAAPVLMASPAMAADTCGAIARQSFGPNVTIASARMIPAGTTPAEMGAPPVDLPAHCRVEGTINAREGNARDGKNGHYGIGFAIALPANWQGRFLLQGGGGLNGSVRPPIGAAASGKIPALARGFAVISHDSSIDPVGPCIGMRGSRVQAVVGELQGEKIDIIQYSTDQATFIVNALAPAEVMKVILDEEKNIIEVVVPDDQLSLAIGRRGQNVRLASQLSGWNIDILTEADESERRQQDFIARTKMFVDALDVDDVIAHLLVTEGFTTIEEVAFVPVEELADIEGFDEDVGAELRERARSYLESREEILNDKRQKLGVKDDLLEVEGLSLEMVVALGEKEIKDRDDLADLAGDELVDLLPTFKLSMDESNAIIMAARAHWFADEDGATGESEDAPAEESKEA